MDVRSQVRHLLLQKNCRTYSTPMQVWPSKDTIMSHSKVSNTSSHQPNYRLYELLKNEIILKNLSPSEYADAIRKLAIETGV